MHKLPIFLFLVFSFNTLYAQKYSFDIAVNYSSQHGDKNENAIGYFNSQNDQYYLALIQRPHSYMAYLYDFSKRQIHQFNLVEVKDGEKSDFKLAYLRSDKLQTSSKKQYLKYVFDFTTVNATDSLKTVKLSVYKNARRTVPVMTYQLEIRPEPLDLFHLFRESALHPFEFSNTLKYPGGGVVINATGNTLTGIWTSFKLEKLQEVAIEVEVP